MRAHLNRALKISGVLSAAMLLASTAFAEPPNAGAQGKGHGAEEAKKDGGSSAKLDDKAKDKADKAEDKGKSASERASRVAKQHEDQKAKLQGMLKGPLDASVKEELRRHAERVARIERIKTVATDAKDTDATDRAAKLIGKENARHDKWMEKHVATTAAATPAAVAPAAAAVKGDEK